MEDLHGRIDFMPQQIGESLHSQLQTSFSRNQYVPLDRLRFFACNESTNCSTRCKPNATKYSLIEHLDIAGVLQAGSWDTKS